MKISLVGPHLIKIYIKLKEKDFYCNLFLYCVAFFFFLRGKKVSFDSFVIFLCS